MIAKLIVLGKSRNEAIKKMKSALSEFIVDGIDTNIDFQMEIMNHRKFQSGNFSTDFIEEMENEKIIDRDVEIAEGVDDGCQS